MVQLHSSTTGKATRAVANRCRVMTVCIVIVDSYSALLSARDLKGE